MAVVTVEFRLKMADVMQALDVKVLLDAALKENGVPGNVGSLSVYDDFLHHEFLCCWIGDESLRPEKTLPPKNGTHVS
jgi:hypothetical protein